MSAPYFESRPSRCVVLRVYREIDMRFWLEQAEAALKELS